MADTTPDLPTIPAFADEPLVLPAQPPNPPRLDRVPDRQLIAQEFPLTGAWVLDDDPLKIGLNNFADLQNWRYTNTGLEGVAGYTKITAAPLGGSLVNGMQFQKLIHGVLTSYLLVQAAGAVYPHTALIPATGNFGAALWTDSAGAGVGRFALGPDATIFYANGKEATIWGSSEHRCAAFMNYDDPAGTFRYDFTRRVTNILTTSAELATLIRDASNDIWLLIGSTRPLKGIKLYVQTPNTAAATTIVQYWNAGWVGVSGLVDGTAVAGKTLAQTGTLSFTSTVSVARVLLQDERLLYFYRVKIGDTGTPDTGIQISHCTVDAPMQPVVDIWDGVNRNPIYAAQAANDYTLEVQSPSSAQAPVAMLVDAQPLAVHIGFEERMTAVRVRMIAGHLNGVAASLTVYYWNGSAFTTVGAVQDGTANAGATLGQSGDVSWDAPLPTLEFPTTIGGNTGFFYFITSGATSLSAEVLIDVLAGIPAQRWNAQQPHPGASFPFAFAGRVMLAGSPQTGEANLIDYCAPGQPDVWNGKQSSDRGKEIRISGAEAFTMALEMSNRYWGVQTALAVLAKANETWILQGNTPENFERFLINDMVGCPAPLSVDMAEVPMPTDAAAIRNVVLWCSAKGPVFFDGAVISLMRFPQPDGSISSVEAYFTPTDSRYVNTAAWSVVRGWYDPQYSEYNLLIPSGAGQTTCNVWLVADLRRRKWYRKVPTTVPTCGMPVYDLAGTPYVYAGMSSGHLLRLEFGTTWDGGALVHQLDTADMHLGQSVWHETLARYAKVLAVRETGAAATLALRHAPNGAGTFATVAAMDIASGTARYVRTTWPLNLTATTHQWRLACTTTDKSRAPRLLGWSVLWTPMRQDLIDH